MCLLVLLMPPVAEATGQSTMKWGDGNLAAAAALSGAS
jgi:hypothetical protein